MSDDFEELLAVPPRRRPGRPSNAEREERRLQAEADLELQRRIRAARSGQAGMDTRDFLQPVSQNFLAQVFRMDGQTVKKRLLKCRPLRSEGGGRPVYDFVEACGYLIKPRMSVEEFARTLNKADVPPEFSNAFWQAQRSRIKYKIEAQEAWETEDVMLVLGEVAMLFRDATTMVIEEMRNRANLTDAQTDVLTKAMDEFRAETRKKLVDLPNRSRTSHMADKPLWGVAEDVPIEPETGWLDENIGDDDE